MKNGQYELVKAPESYPGKRYRNGKWAYEHRVVWWKSGRKLLGDDEILHHKNENKRDNRIENLELMSTSEYTAHHNSTGRSGAPNHPGPPLSAQ